ncbi:TraB/GumN family protein [Sapientia aquatica]|uniref:TraB/GumN family protein n=1 Tax=Sapientia aquatica TaxID=1549640 RepID=A0A4R5VPT8_9BURK|nr:TraB/GumN family protein [Sapientia aquatica]TDK59586.1 TraB/GumN family protein [Sapientia aquatica]
MTPVSIYLFNLGNVERLISIKWLQLALCKKYIFEFVLSLQKLLTIHQMKIKYLWIYLFVFSLSFFASDGNASTNNLVTANKTWWFYKITKNNHAKGYLLGVIHTPLGDLVYPDVVVNSLEKSSKLYLELNIFDEKTKAELQEEFLKMSINHSIDTLLTSKTKSDLDSVITAQNYSREDKKSIYALNPFLAMIDVMGPCALVSFDGDPIEKKLHDQAKKLGHQVAALESVEDNYSWVNKLSKEEWNEYVEAHVRFVKDKDCNRKFNSYILQMRKNMLQGDADQMYENMLKFFTNDLPIAWFFEKYDLTPRNKKMALKIMQSVESEKMPFFAIGAGHLAGQKGVIYELQKLGYSVTQE